MGKGWTFQRLIDDKMTVTAHCHRSPCKNHSRFLDRVKLRDPEMRQALRLIGSPLAAQQARVPAGRCPYCAEAPRASPGTLCGLGLRSY